MKKRFELIRPADFLVNAVIAKEAAQQMVSRLEWMSLTPKIILDIGWGAGFSSQLLKERYPDACVLVIDDVQAFLQTTAKERADIKYICSGLDQLPVKAYDVDLIFANGLLPWCPTMPSLLQTWQHCLKANGLMMITTLGPDTLLELQGSVDRTLLPSFIDMHNMGDELTQAGFLDPVMDVDLLTLSYTDVGRLCEELKSTGFLPMDFDASGIVMQKEQDRFLLTYEIVYGHAWGAGPKQAYAADAKGEVRVPLSALRRKID